MQTRTQPQNWISRVAVSLAVAGAGAGIGIARAQLRLVPTRSGTNTIQLTVQGASAGASCNLLAAPDLSPQAAWTLYLQAAPGVSNFALPLPALGCGFFRILQWPFPMEQDFDQDGIPNEVEIAQGTDPYSADTDGDGVMDSLDAFPLDPSRFCILKPIPGDLTAPTIQLLEPKNAILLP